MAAKEDDGSANDLHFGPITIDVPDDLSDIKRDLKFGLSLFGVGEWVGGGGGAGRVVWGYGYHVVVHRRPATA